MKYLFFFFLLGFSYTICAQLQLDIDGDSKILGSLHLDSGAGNLFVGNVAGASMATGNFNVFVGFENGGNNTHGHSNIFIGDTAGEKNTTGSQNVFIGRHAGQRNIKGTNNVFIGRSAGTFYNPQGSTPVGENVIIGATAGWTGDEHFNNTLIGFEAGYTATNSGNTFLGHKAGRDSGTGMNNVFVGNSSGATNGAGSSNTFIGSNAGNNAVDHQGNTLIGYSAGSNVGGNQNVFIGTSAGFNETDGGSNVFIGSFSGGGSSSGGNNVLLGYQSTVTSAFSNCTALGYDTRCNANNKVRLGNDDVTVIEGAVLPSVGSDFRLKTNIHKSDLGLDFINALNPVQYNYKEGRGNKLFTGLIAQDVEAAALSNGSTFSGVIKPVEDEGHYSLRYAELIMPLINAVKELNKQNKSLTEELLMIKSELSVINNINVHK